MSLALYDIQQAHRAILDSLQIDEDGVITEQSLTLFRQRVALLEGEVQEVVTSLAQHALEREYLSQAAKDAGKKLIERSNRIQRSADELRELARMKMAAVELKKVTGPQLTLTRKLNPPRVLIGEAPEIPPDLMEPAHPMIAEVLAAVRALPGNEDEDAPLVITQAQLTAILAAQLPAPAPDKKAIAKALKAGELIPGVSLEQGERLDIGTTG